MTILRGDSTSGCGRRAALGLLAAAAPAFAARPTRAADAWPSRPVRMLVPFAPGGPSDGLARLLAEALSPLSGQPVIVENRPGAGSVVGTAAAAQANDGHTLLMASMSHVVNPSLHPNLPYDPLTDFAPIGLISTTPLVVTVGAGSSLRTLRDLIAAAKARPGQLTYASAGNGTINHLAAELFKLQERVDLINVTYRGEGALLPDLMSGRVTVGFLNLLAPLPHLREGRLRALAVTAEAPLPMLPDVPSMRAEGVEGFGDIAPWWALVAARGVPDAALDELDAKLAGLLQQPAFRERMLSYGMFPAAVRRHQLDAFFRAEAARWGEVVRRAGIRAD
jgi:tripartite-type tricarboxylate transporter receptor subunit TctC